MERGTLSWRYDVTAQDYGEIRRELMREPCLQMRDAETYYSYMRRMELLAERARELRDIAMDTWTEARERVRREPWVDRDLPSSSTRPRTPPPPPPAHFHPYQPPHYTLDPAGASSSRGLRPTFAPGPSAPVRLGSYSRAPPERLGMEDRERSPSPCYTPGMLSPRGYTWMESDPEDEDTTVSNRSGTRTRESGLRSVEEGEQADDEAGDQIEGSETGEQESGGNSEGHESDGTIEMWVLESPVVEVMNISSDEKDEMMIEISESEEQAESEEVASAATVTSATATSGDSADDPDYVPRV